MTRNRKSRGPVSVTAEMTGDELARHRATILTRRLECQREMLSEFAGGGWNCTSVYDLVNTAKPYPALLPILIKHFDLIDEPFVRQGIMRALTVKYGGRVVYDFAFSRFENEKVGDTRIVIGGVLAVLAESSDLPALYKLVENDQLAQNQGIGGDARLPLLTAIARLDGPNAVPALLKFLVKGGGLRAQAIIELGKLGAKAAEAAIEQFADDPDSYVRSASRTALKRIQGDGRNRQTGKSGALKSQKRAVAHKPSDDEVATCLALFGCRLTPSPTAVLEIVHKLEHDLGAGFSHFQSQNIGSKSALRTTGSKRSLASALEMGLSSGAGFAVYNFHPNRSSDTLDPKTDWNSMLAVSRVGGQWTLFCGTTSVKEFDNHLTDIFKDLTRRFNPSYGTGYCMPIRRGPWLFATGTTLHPPAQNDEESCQFDREMRDNSDWFFFINDEQNSRHIASTLRDIYPMNVLSPEHLKLDVAGQSLREWIEGQGFGKLSDISYDCALWHLSDLEIAKARKSLRPLCVRAE